MRITRDIRKLNRLYDCYRLGDGWVTRSYSPRHAAFFETQMPYGWSPFGWRKVENKDELINDLTKFIERNDWNDANYCRGLCDLRMMDIIVGD
jgi:hypothetical protein